MEVETMPEPTTEANLPDILWSVIDDWNERALYYATVSTRARTQSDMLTASIYDSLQALTHDHLVRIACALRATGEER
jgi:hypothetical protein